MIAILFEIEKEERLVVAVVNLFRQKYRTPDRKAIVMPAHGRLRVQPRCCGVERIVCGVIIGAAMKIVRAGLHDVIEKAAADLSVFRREVARQNGDFLKGIHAWLNLRLGRGYLAITRVLTFEPIRSRVAGSAVDLDRGVRDNVTAGQELRYR